MSQPMNARPSPRKNNAVHTPAPLSVLTRVTRLTRLTRRLHQDTSATTITEFVIVLPIFIMIFNGIMILGQFSRKGTEAPVVAYKETFGEALRFQKSYWTADWNLAPVTAGLDAADQLSGTGWLGDASPAHNDSTAVKATSIVTEGAAYTGLEARGHMGESFARAEVFSVMPNGQIYGCDNLTTGYPTDDCKQLNENTGLSAISTKNGWMTSDLKDRTGESDYAFQLLNDGPAVSQFTKVNGGIWETLNKWITGVGIRPSVAAGIRYGTVSKRVKHDFSFAGQTMTIDAHFSTLVPPGTQGGALGPRVDAFRATAVTRATMEGQQHYKNLPGIAWEQPLKSENFSAGEYDP